MSKLFGQQGDAEKIVEKATTSVPGQSMDLAKLQEAQKRIQETAAHDHQQEAAAFAEEIINWLNEQWGDREFTAEQRIFSVALATVNLRQNFPEERGGKVEFDRVAHDAWQYWQTASSAVSA